MSDSLYYYKYLKYKTLCDNLLGGTPTFNVDKFKKYCEGLSVEDINTKLKEIINNNFIIKTQVSSYIIDNREPSNLKKLVEDIDVIENVGQVDEIIAIIAKKINPHILEKLTIDEKKGNTTHKGGTNKPTIQRTASFQERINRSLIRYDFIYRLYEQLNWSRAQETQIQIYNNDLQRRRIAAGRIHRSPSAEARINSFLNRTPSLPVPPPTTSHSNPDQNNRLFFYAKLIFIVVLIESWMFVSGITTSIL